LRRNEEQGAEKDDKGDCSPGEMTGGYYWLPAPDHPTICWDVVICHQLGFDAEVGHVEMWTAVTDRLASAWHKDAAVLRLLLVLLAQGTVHPTRQVVSYPPRRRFALP
jgi:hypothetical protein